MKLITILFLVFYSLCVSSQDVKVSSSKEYTNELEGAFWTSVLGQDETGYYLLREYGAASSRKKILDKLDLDFNHVFSVNIESSSGVMGDSKYHRYTEMRNGKILVFLSGMNKEEGTSKFYVKELDLQGQAIGEEIPLMTHPSKNLFKSVNREVAISPDGSKILVTTEPMFDKKAKDKLSLEVFSSTDYSSLWKQEITFENDAERSPIHDLIVDKAGNAYIYKDVKISRKEHEYKLLFANKEQFKISDIDLGDNYPTQRKLSLDSNGDLIILGILAPSGAQMTTWQNVWFLKANNNGEIMANQVEPLGFELLHMIVRERDAKTEGFLLHDYKLIDVLEKPNGGHLLITELQKTSSKPIDNNMPPTYEYTIDYGGILMISFDENGKRDWNTYYDKNQKIITRDPDMSLGSFAHYFEGDHLNLVWNYTDEIRDRETSFRYWIDANGSKINIDNLYGAEALYATLLTSINTADGSFVNTERTFYSLPLTEIQRPNSFKMAVDPSITFNRNDSLIILSRMQGEMPKRYKFNIISHQ